jgi:inositol-1,3,4-trisphosphate 5/6-kinase/inositol-tetrakisphosphate 1-kinase
VLVVAGAMVSGGCVGAEGNAEPEAVVSEEAVTSAPAPARELVVGYALTSKKAKSFLQPKLRGLARYWRNFCLDLFSRVCV